MPGWWDDFVDKVKEAISPPTEQAPSAPTRPTDDDPNVAPLRPQPQPPADHPYRTGGERPYYPEDAQEGPAAPTAPSQPAPEATVPSTPDANAGQREDADAGTGGEGGARQGQTLLPGGDGYEPPPDAEETAGYKEAATAVGVVIAAGVAAGAVIELVGTDALIEGGTAVVRGGEEAFGAAGAAAALLPDGDFAAPMAVEELDPPVDELDDPPVDELDPPVDQFDPPADELDAPADELDTDLDGGTEAE